MSTPLLADLRCEDKQFGGPPAMNVASDAAERPALISRRWVVTDMSIRDVPDDVIAAVDEHDGRLGLSRTEYVRRRLAQDASVQGSAVGVQDLRRFAETFPDLADPEVMSPAWR